MVGYKDGSVLAQMGCPDMRTAIGYALSHPQRASLTVERLDFARLARLDFEAPDDQRFPALALARRAMERGGAQGTVLNAAKEIALSAFIDGRLGFLGMARIVARVMEAMEDVAPANSMQEVFAIDAEARQRAARIVDEDA